MKQFEQLVKEMRAAQRALFIKNTPENIQKVKKLEHSVDKWLEVQTTKPVEMDFSWPFPGTNAEQR